MLLQYNKDTESCRENVENESIEVSLKTHPELVTEGADHLPVALFTK